MKQFLVTSLAALAVSSAYSQTTKHSFCWYFLKNNWAIRKGDWKLLVGQHDPSKKAPMEKKDTIFLVNVTQNPEEMLNVADQYPDK